MATHDKPKRPARHKIREGSRAAYQELILEAAERVFARRGFAGTRMSDVAAEARVSTGTLYNYFDSKDEVFRSLLELRSAVFLAGVKRVYAATADPVARIGALVRFVFEYVEAHRAAYAVFVELGGMSESSIGSIGGDKLVDEYTEYVALFERAFRAAARTKRLRPTIAKPVDLAQLLTGAMNGVTRAWVIGGGSQSLTRKADMIIEVFLGELPNESR